MMGRHPLVTPTKTATKVSLCVGVQRAQSSIERGKSAQWIVSAWTQGGDVPDAIVRLVATPASVTPKFSFGCGSHDGTSSCDLGAIDAKSAQRQLQARVAISATSSTVKSVKLTAIISAAHLPKSPEASATVKVTAAPAGTGTSATPTPATTTTPLSVGSLPYLQGASPTLSPGGNAAGLFPALSPSDPSSSTSGSQKANARTVANTSALPLGAPVVSAQLIGLGVLALAFVLAVTRLSVRRRPAVAAAPAGSRPSGTGPSPAPAEEPAPAEDSKTPENESQPPADDSKADDDSKPDDSSKPDEDVKADDNGKADEDGEDSEPEA
jgi:hypothetical protein